jgi:hypothetical protein
MKEIQRFVAEALFGCLVAATVLTSACGNSELALPPAGFDTPEPYYLGSTIAVPGKTYAIARDDCPSCQDVFYLAGNLPIVISVPHGGSLAPPEIPIRACGTTANDRLVIELAGELKRSLFKISRGGYPHIVVNNLDRSLVDQNRNVTEDCNPNPTDPTASDYQGTLRAKNAWDDFHLRFIAAIAIPSVLEKFGKGFYVDLHGHSSIGYPDIMLGYNLTALDLSNSDATLNDRSQGYIDKSSLRFMYDDLQDKTTFANLLRGDKSAGEILRRKLDDRYPNTYSVAPSAELQKPMLMLSGEYNIQVFGGVKDGDIDNNYGYDQNKFMSGFQLEVCGDLRDDETKRKEFAEILTHSLDEFLGQYY